MRKVILPLIVCLALVASIGAGTYKAYVTMKIDPVVGPTAGAELAFAPGSGLVSPDFVRTDPNNSMQVIMAFGDVQPNSTYEYHECLKVTNNKPYDVELKVWAVTGNITTLDNLEIWHTGCSCNPYEWMYSSKYGGVKPAKIILKASGDGGGCDTDYISFHLNTDYNDSGGTYTGTVTFRAFRWEAK